MMNNYIDEMEKIAVKAGAFAKEKFLEGITGVALKARNDYVTDTDRMVEKFIKEELKRPFPEIPLLTEEGSSSAKGDENLFFCLDPLDGTNNYVHSLPIFCVSLALLEGKEPKIGVVYDPMHDELFKAEKGKGAFLNGKRIETSGKTEIGEAFVATGFPFRERGRVSEYLRGFEKVLCSTGGIRRCGAAAIDLCWTAAGRFDAFWEFGLKPWDIAAGIVIVQEAKGCISDVYGGAIDIFKGDILASATEELKESMVGLLK
jgi:myo-inositol-1(or 4)-monophosphatase